MSSLRFLWKAEVEGGVATGWLEDHAGRTVARGTGATVRDAQQNALETTTSEDARLFLQQVLFPNEPTE
jgi:hypothetical protein